MQVKDVGHKSAVDPIRFKTLNKILCKCLNIYTFCLLHDKVMLIFLGNKYLIYTLPNLQSSLNSKHFSISSSILSLIISKGRSVLVTYYLEEVVNGAQLQVSLTDLECLDSCLLVLVLDTKAVGQNGDSQLGPLHVCGVGSLKRWRRGRGCHAFYSHLPQRRSEVKHSSLSGKCLGTSSDLSRVFKSQKP